MISFIELLDKARWGLCSIVSPMLVYAVIPFDPVNLWNYFIALVGTCFSVLIEQWALQPNKFNKYEMGFFVLLCLFFHSLILFPEIHEAVGYLVAFTFFLFAEVAFYFFFLLLRSRCKTP